MYSKYKEAHLCDTIRISIVENFLAMKVCAMPRNQEIFDIQKLESIEELKAFAKVVIL